MARVVVTIEDDGEPKQPFVFEAQLNGAQVARLMTQLLTGNIGPSLNGSAGGDDWREEREQLAIELLGEQLGLRLLAATTEVERLTILTAAADQAGGPITYDQAREWLSKLGLRAPSKWTAIWAHAQKRGLVKMERAGVYRITPSGRRFAKVGR